MKPQSFRLIRKQSSSLRRSSLSPSSFRHDEVSEKLGFEMEIGERRKSDPIKIEMM